MRTPFGRPRASVPSVPLAGRPVPPTLGEVVRKIQFVRGFKGDGGIVGMAFGGASLGESDKPTLSLLLRTSDGRAWGDVEPMDVMGDPEAQAGRMILRAERGDACRGMLPTLDALHRMCAPNGDPNSARRTNMADALSCGAKELERAGFDAPFDAEPYGVAQKASFEQTILLLGVAKLFEGTLDPDAVALARSRRSRLRDVDGPGLWEAMDRTFDPRAPLARAMRHAPGLSRAIAWAFEDDRRGFDAALGEGRLDAYLAPRTGLPKRLWPALAALREVTAGVAEDDLPPSPSLHDPLVHWVGKLTQIPPDWVPGSPAEWLAYLDC